MIDWSTIRHFVEAEFACPCGACPGSMHPPMDEELVRRLDLLRACYGRPIRVTSGYRCPTRNAATKGADDSAHLTGQAVDVRWGGKWKKWLLVVALERTDRLEIAPKHLHIEHRPTRPPAVWVGKSR